MLIHVSPQCFVNEPRIERYEIFPPGHYYYGGPGTPNALVRDLSSLGVCPVTQQLKNACDTSGPLVQPELD